MIDIEQYKHHSGCFNSKIITTHRFCKLTKVTFSIAINKDQIVGP
jgi:hypothetical protein